MECREFLSNLSEFVDGRLEAAEARAIEQHAAACASCGCRLKDYRLLGEVLRSSLPEAEPPVARMWASIQSRLPTPAPRPNVFQTLLDFVRAHALALAPVPIAAVALMAYLSWNGGPAATVAQVPAAGSGRVSTHSSGEQRQLQELDTRRWDYIETGFKKYARTVRSKHAVR